MQAGPLYFVDFSITLGTGHSSIQSEFEPEKKRSNDARSEGTRKLFKRTELN